MKWYRKAKKSLEAAGCEVQYGGKHIKVFHGGKLVATMPVTVSDYRGVRNLQSDLRRAGVDVTLPRP